VAFIENHGGRSKFAILQFSYWPQLLSLIWFTSTYAYNQPRRIISTQTYILACRVVSMSSRRKKNSNYRKVSFSPPLRNSTEVDKDRFILHGTVTAAVSAWKQNSTRGLAANYIRYTSSEPKINVYFCPNGKCRTTTQSRQLHEDVVCRVPTLLLTKNPGLFQDFPGPHEKFSRTFLEPANV